MSVRYKTKGPAVVAEAFEGEVVVVNLDSGRYYSLADAGADIWTLIVGGASVDGVVDWLTGSYEGPRDAIASAVQVLVAQLRDEDLIVALPDAASSAGGTASDLPLRPDRPRPVFAAPTLAVYSDMQDLLVLDPIHDVDETGWPAKRA